MTIIEAELLLNVCTWVIWPDRIDPFFSNTSCPGLTSRVVSACTISPGLFLLASKSVSSFATIPTLLGIFRVGKAALDGALVCAMLGNATTRAAISKIPVRIIPFLLRRLREKLWALATIRYHARAYQKATETARDSSLILASHASVILPSTNVTLGFLYTQSCLVPKLRIFSR